MHAARTAFAGVIFMAFLATGCSRDQTGNDDPDNSPAAGMAAAAPGLADGPAAGTAQTHAGVVQGTVTDVSGQPVSGAFVKLHNTSGRLSFMVISQEGGRYTADKLPAGSYTVQAVGGDFESAWSAPVSVSNGAAGAADVKLDQPRAPDLAPAWPRRLPEHLATLDALPAGPGKDVIASKCSGCHSADQVVASRYDEDTWRSTVGEMQELIAASGRPELSDADENILLDYLFANLAPLPPPDPNSRFPHDLMRGEALHYRVVQYNLEEKGVETHDVAVDPWGIGWANQRTGGMISRFDPVTYEYREVGPPLYTAERARPGNLQISSDGIMWLADPFEMRWLSYDIANDKWTDWPFPADRIRGPVQGNSLVLHPDGTVWMSGHGSVRRLDPATGEWSTWDTASWIETHEDPGGYGITVAGDGRVWMAENLADKLARFDGESGQVAEFQLEAGAYPRRMDHDNDGNVWVALWGAGQIVRIDYKTDEMTLIDPPIPDNGAYSIDFDQSTNLLWVSLQKVDVIARLDPDTMEWLMLPMPQAESDIRRIEVDQNNPR
ncbi:MAG TPA: carboxypeptidase regulatory-like domain-containing protein, partial [Woeseiaceae bacterium]|nr:carboxypeptidase regulatory-like domain-containing protein [Woeseiaceae bacterium]